MLLKGCHRCGGDLYDEPALGQPDLVCLQCGFRASGAAVMDSLALAPGRESKGEATAPALPAGARRG